MKHILVTGGAGFIGSHLVPRLLHEGYRVTVLDDLSNGNRAYVPIEASFLQQDIRDMGALASLFEKEVFDGVVHFAAQTMVSASIDAPLHDCELNIAVTVSLLELCRKYNVPKVVFASTAAVYGDNSLLPLQEDVTAAPLSFYGLSKYTVERYLDLYHKLYGIEYAVLRFANVYGERQGDSGEGGVVSIFTRRLHQGQALQIFGNGEQTRDFIYAGDVAAAVVAVFHSDIVSDIYNVSTGRETTLLELVALLGQAAKKKPVIEYQDSREGDILRSKLDSSRLQRVSSWYPQTSLLEGLKRTFFSLI